MRMLVTRVPLVQTLPQVVARAANEQISVSDILRHHVEPKKLPESLPDAVPNSAVAVVEMLPLHIRFQISLVDCQVNGCGRIRGARGATVIAGTGILKVADRTIERHDTN
tara:strand:+ start:237 stop:566 length:330 start_codon:yes stop_codon:yes gene_type:complete